MDIKLVGHTFEYDITSMSMLFFPGEKVNYVNRSSADKRIISAVYHKDNKIVSVTRFRYNNKNFYSQRTVNSDYDIKNLVKQTFYLVCRKATGISSDWGILTGIRPLSVYSKLNKNADAFSLMKSEYFVSSSKIHMLKKINSVYSTLEHNSGDVSIYISIPFCPGKCSYCSFISVSATSTGKMLDDYLLNLHKEIELKADIIKKLCLNIRSLYIGGGTPGVLNEIQLESLLSVLEKHLGLKNIDETCIEIGRPETLTEHKLKIINNYSFNRICINTQSTNDNVLSIVNRKHTYKQYVDAVKVARNFKELAINTDLIAGLPDETYESFCQSVNDVISLGVENITIHTLALKRSAKLYDDVNNFKATDNKVDLMVNYAYNTLIKAGYIPYYIYRQKNCVSNGENIGFCMPEYVCKYNLYMMEDIHSIIACGAGASSKVIDGSKVDRVINLKYPMEYNSEFYKIINNTNKLFEILKVKRANE